MLFVDDGSTDGAWGRIEEIVREAPEHAAALRLAKNGGKAEAVRKGMLQLLSSGYAYVGFWDADLAAPLDAIPQFIDVLDRRQDIHWVFGARVRLLGRHIEPQAVRHYFGRIFATTTSLALSLPVYDTQCGAKLFRASATLEQVLATPFMSRWIFEVEMIARLAAIHRPGWVRNHALQIYELPLLKWTDVKGSKVRPRDFVRAAAELARIHLKYGGRSRPRLMAARATARGDSASGPS